MRWKNKSGIDFLINSIGNFESERVNARHLHEEMR
jgi:hypothetical protein